MTLDRKKKQKNIQTAESSGRKWKFPHEPRVCDILNKNTLCINKRLPSIRFKRGNTYEMTLKSVVISIHLTGQLSCHDVKCDITMSVLLFLVWTSASVCECVWRGDKFVLSVEGGFDGLFVMVQESLVSVCSSFAPSSEHVDKDTHKTG